VNCAAGLADGWYITPDNRKQTFFRTLPRLSGLYMVGQWTAPFTGAAIAALSGCQLIQLLCNQIEKVFVIEEQNRSEARLAA
jgi:phytoene dehydrogenase-like protein